jgi:polyhydroxyalkanoate synthesis regulator phasin
MTIDQIEKLTKDMVKEGKQIRRNAKKLSWYMRGGVSYTDIMNMSQEEVDDLNSIIEENLETTKKTKLPFF